MDRRGKVRTTGVVHVALVAALITAAASTATAQSAHQVPFASEGNVIELLLENSTQTAIPGLSVQLTDPPPWLRMAPEEQAVTGRLLPGKPHTVSFTFDVDKSAPVGTVQQLRFTVSSGSGERWTKSIPISVLPPQRFELLQNYPNPFNPSTTIAFILPRASEVTLKVYNLLGEEMAILVRATLEAGYHETVWDAPAAASGVYIYRLTAPGTVLTGRMMLLR